MATSQLRTLYIEYNIVSFSRFLHSATFSIDCDGVL